MKTKLIKCFALLLSLASLLNLAGCGNKTAKFNYGTEHSKAPVKADNFGISWDFDTEAGSFTVTDSRNGKTWTGGLTDEYYGKTDLSDIQKSNKLCLFSVTYADEDNNIEVCYSNGDSVQVEYSRKGTVVTAEAAIEGTGLYFQVIFELTGNTLTVTVPADKVKEDGEYKLITIEILPFFGACVSGEDGYIFYPDGSGALYDFGNRNESDSQTAYKRQMYCDFFNNYEEFLRDEEAGIETVMLPIFGIKQGNGAILGNVTEGSAETTLSLYPFGYIYDAARVCPTFNFRFLYELQATSGGKLIVPVKKRSEANFQVQYTFLAGDDANYSGMARTYRQFLLENKLMEKSDVKISLYVDFLMSLKKPVLFWEQSVAASTFGGVSEALKELSKKNVNNAFINLLGWQSSGYAMYPSSVSAAGACGGNRELKKLIENSKKSGMTVQLQDNFFLALKKRSGQYGRDDLAAAYDNSTYIDLNEENLLLDFRSAKQRFEHEFITKASSYGAAAVSLDDAGHILYSNGSAKNPLSRTGAMLTLEKMLKTASERFNTVTVSGANAYALKYADILSDVTQSSSGSFLFDRDVTFVQMVLHGYIPFMPEIPGNFSDDYNETLLTWAEQGCVPYFSVSEKSGSQLKDCYSNGVLVQRFDEIEDMMLTAVTRLEKIIALNDVAVYSRETTKEGLSVVKYSDGTYVLVNKTDKEIDWNGHKTEAKSFSVFK